MPVTSASRPSSLLFSAVRPASSCIRGTTDSSATISQSASATDAATAPARRRFVDGVSTVINART